ncbi:hypothetical protein [Nocardia tengchongensis]|uniref:hypothetical protein n=1 Tax=Nocardia tengchongensis TaxID=2055889 RepID=UPI0036894CD9
MSQISSIVPAAAIAVSLFTVAYQVWNSRRQARISHRAEMTAKAFFDLYEGWALNRRAQIEPVNLDLLRTSAAQFYASAFRLAALIEGPSLAALKNFLQTGLGEKTPGDESLNALYALHHAVTECLGYKAAVPRDEMAAIFWTLRKNVPTVLLGAIEPTAFAELLPVDGVGPRPTSRRLPWRTGAPIRQ